MPQNTLALNFGSVNARRVGLGSMPKIVETDAYTLEARDANRYLRFTSATDVDITVPAEDDVNIPIQTCINFEAAGTGNLTVAGAGGVTINSSGAKLSSNGQFSVLGIIKVGSDEWTLIGDRA